jgi:hypothetical protein
MILCSRIRLCHQIYSQKRGQIQCFERVQQLHLRDDDQPVRLCAKGNELCSQLNDRIGETDGTILPRFVYACLWSSGRP